MTDDSTQTTPPSEETTAANNGVSSDSSMGAAPRTPQTEELVVVMKCLSQLASTCPRFPPPPSSELSRKQLDEKDRWLNRAGFAPCDQSSEEAMEDWLDVQARIVTKFRLSVDLFRELWEAATSTETATVIAGVVPDSTSYEEVISAVVKRLFPRSRYIFHLEDLLYAGKRQATVLAARQWLERHCQRYLRVCRRWGCDPSLSDSRLMHVYYSCLPVAIESRVRIHTPKDLEDLFQYASIVEAEDSRSRTTAMGVFTVGDEETGGAAKKAKIGERVTYPPCKGCGLTNHPYKKCFRKTWRCKNCDMIGHIAPVCPNFVEKDAAGRVVAKVESKKGSTEVTMHKDSTQGDKVNTVDAFIHELRNSIERGREKAQGKREKKREEANLPPAPPRTPHPVGAVHSTEAEDSKPADLIKLLYEAMCAGDLSDEEPEGSSSSSH